MMWSRTVFLMHFMLRASHVIASRSVLNECLSYSQILAQQRTTIKAGTQVVSSTAYGCVGTISFY